MARDLTSGMQAEVQAPVLRPVIFYEGEFSTGTLRLWSGLGTIAWNGQTWTGAGNAIGFSEIAETADIRAAGMTVSLSGNVSSLIAAALAEARYGKPGKVWLGCVGDETLESGTAQAGSTNTLTLAAGASGEINAHANKLLRLTGGAGSAQERSVFTYDSVTKVATVSPGWRVNLVARSEEIDQWTDGGAAVTANAFADPNGDVTIDTLTDDSAAVYEYRNRLITVPNDSATYVIECLVRKDLAATHRCGFNINLSGGAPTVSATARFALDGIGLNNCTMTDRGDGYYLFQSTITNNASGNTSLTINAYPATSPTKTGGDVVTAVGSMSIGWVHIRRSTDADDYIKTTAAAVALPDATTTYEVIDKNGIVADPYLAFVGRLDVPVIDDAGASCVISMQYESRLIDLQRTRERRWTHEDQQIDFPGDLGFEYVTSLPDQVLIW